MAHGRVRFAIVFLLILLGSNQGSKRDRSIARGGGREEGKSCLPRQFLLLNDGFAVARFYGTYPCCNTLNSVLVERRPLGICRTFEAPWSNPPNSVIDPMQSVRPLRLSTIRLVSLRPISFPRYRRSFATNIADVYDVVIVGGGPVGLSLASALRTTSLHPTTHHFQH